jgi:competence protein ComEC
VDAGRRILAVRETFPGSSTEWITLDVASVARRPARWQLTGSFRNARGVRARIRVTWYDRRAGRDRERPASLRPRAGERWRLRVSHRQPRGRLNPGGWDYEAYLFRHGIHRTGYVRDDPGNRRLAAAGPLATWRNDLAVAMRRSAGDPFAAAVLPAVATGQRDGLGEEDWHLLAKTGTAHLVAISGLHVGLVAGFVFLATGWTVRRLPVRPPLNRDDMARVAALAAAACYAGLSGFAVPARRALVMLGVWTLAGLLRRRPRGTDILALAAIVVLAADPLAVLDPGFWMSFAAVGTLLLAAGGRRGAALLVRVQGALWLGLLVPTAAAFGRVSLLAPAANLLAVPVFSLLVVPVTLAGVAVEPCMPGLADTLWSASGHAVTFTFDMLREIADRVPADIRIAPPEGLALALGTAAAVAYIAPGSRAGKAACLTAMLLVMAARPAPPEPGGFRLTVLDVGQGHAAIIETRRRVLVYDAGPRWPGGDAGAQSVAPALRAAGVRRLDALVISHPDIDHAGGAAHLVTEFRPREMRGAVPDPAAVPCRRGQGWRWDGVDFAVFHPRSETAGRTDNDRSCVLWVGNESGGALLPGDISDRAEAAIARSLAARSIDVVVAPHHGSSTSSSAAFVSAAAARWAVFTTVPGNRWGFPDPRVAARWRAGGAATRVTGREGALVFEFPARGAPALAGGERRRRCRYWRDCGSL